MIISRQDIESVYPLSPMQEGIFFHLQLESGVPLYCIQQVYEVSGPLDMDRLDQACDRLARQYDILRTGFVWSRQKQALQVLYKSVDFSARRFDWRALPKSQRIDRLQQFCREDLNAGFDFRHAPLLRFQIIQVDENQYYLCKTCHHLITDGTSSSILMQALAKNYDDSLRDRVAFDPKLPRFREYVKWLGDRDIEQDKLFWREYLKDFRPDLLPEVRPQSPHVNSGSKCLGTDTISTHCSVQTSLALRQLARRLHITANTLIQGLWSLVWARQSSHGQLLYGITLSGRPSELPGADQMVGPFIHTVPVKAIVRPQLKVSTWLHRVQSENIEILEHAQIPLSQIQSYCHCRPGIGLFDSLFVFENYDKGSNRAAIDDQNPIGPKPIQLTRLFQADATHYPLTLYVVFQEQLTIRLSYKNRHFGRESIQLLIQQLHHIFERVIELAAVDPNLSNTTVESLLTIPKIHQRAIERWNPPLFQGDGGALVLQRMKAQCNNSGDKVAIEVGSRRIRYRELFRMWQVAANYLSSQGIHSGDRVGVSLANGAELWAIVLGIWQVGASYVPIDRRGPDLRRKHCCDQAKLAGLVAERSDCIFDSSRGVVAKIWAPEEVFLDDGAALPDLDGRETHSQQIAYLMYTSGTTGRQKGIRISHINLASFLDAIQSELAFKSGDRWLVVSAPTFDISLLEWLLPLLHGGQIVTAQDSETRDGELLRALVERSQARWIQATPSMWRLLLDAGWKGGEVNILSGGEALSTELAENLHSRVTCMWNVYGPTECTVWCTAWQVSNNIDRIGVSQDQNNKNQISRIKIGRALENSHISVRDPGLCSLPIGSVGELCIGGAGVALGYDELPRDTALRFVPDPDSPTPGRRLYRSGDLVQWGRDGQLEFIHRIGHQVKIRGHRIELEEIEQWLRKHESVSQAAVRTRRQDDELQLVAAVRKHDSTTWNELDRFLGELLPRVMIPSRWVAIDRIPLTSSGKIDELSLAQRIESHAVVASTEHNRCYELTETEQLLIGIWSKVLANDAINLESNFFACGGHSLLAMQVVARMRVVFGREIPVRTLFDFPGLRSLAKWVDTGASSTGIERPKITQIQQPDYALSFAQERLWFLHQFDEMRRAYNLVSAIRIRGQIHDGAMKRAALLLCERHEALRTKIQILDGQPRQIIDSSLQPSYLFSDLRGYAPHVQEDLIDAAIERERERVFDFEVGPLWTFEWLSLGDTRGVNEGVLVMNFHHVIADGWSLKILIRDLENLYEREISPEKDGATHLQLPALHCRVVDHAQWQHRFWGGDIEQEHLRYWKKHLEGAPEHLLLPSKLGSNLASGPSRKGGESKKTGRIRNKIPETTFRLLQRLTLDHDLSPFMVYLAGLYIVLARYCRVKDICIGSAVSGRSHVELESIVGTFVNVLVLRGQIDLQGSFLDIAKHVRSVTLEGLSHQELPFERLVRALHPNRNDGEMPLFQVMFSMHQFPNEGSQLAAPQRKHSVEVLSVPTTQAKTDLILHAFYSQDRAEVHFEYDASKFDSDVIDALSGEYQRLLSACSQEPEVAIYERMAESSSDTPVLDSLPDSVSGRCEEKPKFEDLIIGWRHQVGMHRHETALVDDRGEWTYDELDQWSDKIAHAMIQNGVGPEAKVGLWMQRSASMLVAMLGILKAGGCYVPFDFGAPEDRVWRCMVDCGARLMVTDRNEWSEVNRNVTIANFDRMVEMGGANRSHLATDLHSDNLAYIIYTSGSTGHPKGVGVTHRQAVDLLASCRKTIGFDCQDTWTLFHSTAFDFSIWEIWGAWLNGGKLVMVPYETSRNPEAFCTLLQDESVTVLSQTPSAFSQLSEWLIQSQQELPSLRLVVFGGEYLDLRRFQAWVARYGCERPKLVNMYGITETTIHVTHCPIEEESYREGMGNIGRPLPEVRLSVLDPKMNPLPQGAIGEMYISGVGVSRGYINRPAETAWRFVPDTGGVPGSRCFRSGDLGRIGRFRNKACLQYLGRMDRQIQLRGHRVELDEIVYHLCQYDQVVSAFVCIGTEADAGLGTAQQLTAYIQWSQGQVADVDGLRTFSRNRMPSYMVPSMFISVQKIPMTQNHKVDVSALAKLTTGKLEVGKSAECKDPNNLQFARTGVEQIVAEIWVKHLEREKIGVFDDFFDIGGHSLLAIKVMESIRKEIGVRTPLTAIFQAPTIASLSQAIGNQMGEENDRSILLDTGIDSESGARNLQIYCIHPGGGHVRGYKKISEHLSRQGWTVKGIQSRAVIDGTWKTASVASMAQSYAELIVSETQAADFSHKLPIGLLGWSMGGVLAIEMAAILEEQGFSVAFLGIIDAPITQINLDDFGNDIEDVDRRGTNSLEHYAIQIGLEVRSESFRKLSKLRGPELKLALEHDLLNTDSEDKRLSLVIEAAKSLDVIPESYSLELCKWRIAVLEEARTLVRNHRPRALNQDILVWLAQSEHREKDVVDRLRSFVSGRIDIKQVAANHAEIVQSKVVLEEISTCMLDAEKRWNLSAITN